MPSPLIPVWLLWTVAAVIGANLLAIATTQVTIGLMRGMTPLALASRAFEEQVLLWWRPLSFVVGTTAILVWLDPLVRWSRAGRPQPAPPVVAARTVEAPLVVAALGFALWLIGLAVFPFLTLWRFGTWAPELASQQILSPLVNGFLAATTSFLLVDGVFRRCLVPDVFPDGRLAEVRARIPGLRGRLLVFLVAVAFIPLFTSLGLVRAAAARQAAGLPAQQLMAQLVHASEVTFGVWVLFAVALTLLVAGTLTRPLAEVAAALRRVRAGEVGGAVRVTSADEVGVVADGVNALLTTLREKARILEVFGRAVEPSVRDRLLAGAIAAGGEVRHVTVMFCDLRGSTALAERTTPTRFLATLNAFFAETTAAVRASGGHVDRFVGDGFLAVFGLFDDAPPARHAATALGCVATLRARLAALNARRAASGEEPLAMKLGVHAGEAVAGTVGAADRHEYTVVGDVVNVAARLEALCSERGYEVLVSATAWDLALGAGPPLAGAPVGSLPLRGRDEPVAVYRLD